MILNRSFLKTAETYRFNTLNKAFSEKLKRIFPKHLHNFTNDDILNYIIHKRIKCNELSIFSERGIFGYLALGILLGEDFLNSNVFLEIFENTDLCGDQMLEVFFSELTTSCE
ncbi:hypothetical protein [Adhaeribacter aerolatus]|nr:hypothetical protein [Adhaeribacter aerolatus]